MGRGRAKAKQTKVARQLKYNSGGTDLSRLANELGATQPSIKQPPNSEPLEDELDDDPYAQYAARYNDDEDEDDQTSDQSAYRRRA
ncbi:hypothetical protein BLA24_09700 [Streptomyces cinnamoneus]|uniref:Uncharacterized protein n=1 Tax=Streptomyces cinnamoneus TaxID=53446 RepID=A0A2G1XLC6_STRCJ|nr:DUF3073 domain-containing protein [Streptomyces cinnamoneus]PHQ50830.1 hypothetical protein BLA24_18900 [Streptomyces cinnamoneus]PHQ52064.1 hypothetical protein BLA24_09700 [Streptomyces cinnamoneus]PPT13912.1 DUF3073 domain-containing protein [Streptomyces cinnamoneus]